jgi:hypothetical protein
MCTSFHGQAIGIFFYFYANTEAEKWQGVGGEEVTNW